MHCLMAIDFGDAGQAVALPIAMVAIEDLLRSHGCDQEQLEAFLPKLQAWLTPQAIQALKLYGASNTLEVDLVDRKGSKSRKQFKGKGCSLSPAHTS